MITQADRVQETTETAGNGTLDLDGAAVGFQGFVAGAGDGAEVYYTIAGRTGTPAEGQWEVGIGTVTDAAPDTLSRDTVLSSSTGAKVVFLGGIKDVFLTIPAAAPVVNLEVFEMSGGANVDIDIAGYEAVKVFGWAEPTNDADYFVAQVSNDGGATFRDGLSDYAWSRRFRNITTSTEFQDSDPDHNTFFVAGSVGNAAGEQVRFEMEILNPREASANTMHRSCFSYVDENGQLWTMEVIGLVNTAEVNDAIRFRVTNGMADGRISVYGFPAP